MTRPDHRRDLRRAARTGAFATVLFLGTLGVWATTANISGAVIAPAQVVVASEVKLVQHPTGGVVGELLVREGDRVEAGQVVLRLDDTATRASLAALTARIDELAARQARLLAERHGGARIETPPELAARSDDLAVASLLDGEQRLLEARAAARDGRKAQLAQQVAQLREEVRGLLAQEEARGREIDLLRREADGVRQLHEQGLAPLSRLTDLDRDLVILEGERARLATARAQAEGRIAETGLRIVGIDEDLRAEVLAELREVEATLAELTERSVASAEELARVEIRAPATGTVHELAVHTVGGVVAAGEPLMRVVPEGEALYLEAQVPAARVDQVRPGQEARIRLHAFNQRTTPELPATVTALAPDAVRDPQTGALFYAARLALAPGDMGGQHLLAGMQADVFIATDARTPLGYLLEPVQDQFDRALRER